MKRKILILTMAMMMAGSALAGCGAKKATETDVNTLVEQENNLFNEHEELWGKVFENMDKETSVEQLDAGGAYADILRTAIEKTTLTETEKETLEKDVKQIEELEAKIAELEKD